VCVHEQVLGPNISQIDNRQRLGFYGTTIGNGYRESIGHVIDDVT